jgi:hypothetical protein
MTKATKVSEVVETTPLINQPAFELDREIHIVIGDKVYLRADIGEDLQRIISTVNFSDQEIATCEQNLQLYKYGRDRMVQDLIDAVAKSDIEAVAEQKAPEVE